ncbi:hypothetical protein DPMN_083686 [Dreissena polymorpha]|uniref:Uncharacterized protein n=1 Tax=Dreissena polymorpha TaxID=45954 RepID=A0A9D3YCF2_DREPO|nr:hypothetical protein DPMN_083686 [Dreissena polymorpha]
MQGRSLGINAKQPECDEKKPAKYAALRQFRLTNLTNLFAHLRGKNILVNSHETNVLSKFHENWAKHVTSTKNAPPTGGHDDWANIVTSRVFTRENCHYIHIEKNAPPTGGHVLSPISTIFELVRDIN